MSRRSRELAPLFVTGAPGAGKTAVVEHLLRDPPAALIFDVDWLLQPASELTGHSLVHARHLWPAYTRLWLEVLRLVARNRRPAVLFSPLAPLEVAALAPCGSADPASWCLLDCDDATRVARLRMRGWTDAMIEEAVADGQALRDQVDFVVGTADRGLDATAAHVRSWIEQRLATRAADLGVG